MSDSEEEVSFASADEGDGSKATEGSSKEVKKKLEGKEKPSKEAEPAQNKDGQKGSDKRQQQSRAKGQTKGDNQATQKDAKSKTGPSSEQQKNSEPKNLAGTKTSSGTKSSPAPTKLTPAVTKTPAQTKTQAETTPPPKVTSTVKTPEEKTAKAPISEASGNSKETAKQEEKLYDSKKDTRTSTTAQSLDKRESVKNRNAPEKDLGKAETPATAKGDIKVSPESQHEVKPTGLESKDAELSLQQGVISPAGQAIPRDQRDHTPEQEQVLEKLGESSTKGSGGGWGWSNWGSSILSAATNSVQTFTHQVGDGFTTILETVESSLGVPDPQDILKAEEVTEPIDFLEEQSAAVTSQPDQFKEEEAIMSNKFASSERSKATTELIDDIEDSKEKIDDERKDATGGGDSWFSGWSMADLAKKVQDTGKSLASKGQTLMSEGFDAVENLAAGGIDVLESIGKKTYNTLSEHDPAFRKTREYLSPKSNKPNLSSVLREAKEKAEFEAEQERENEEASKAHFGTLFDNYQGIVHLEALEMLSNQSEKKVHSLLNALSTADLASIKPTLISIKEAFEINEDDDSDTPKEQDFTSLVSQYVSELKLGTAPDKLNRVHEMVKQWIVDFDSHESHESDSLKEIHQKSIQALAELTAKGVEQFHKAGELVLLERDTDKDCVERARSLARLTGVLCHEVGNLAGKFVEILNKMAGEGQQTEEVTPLVTNVYLEATNSSTYIQDAFQLLLPVLQHAALEHSILSRQS